MAVEIALDGTIGEDKRIELIGGIEVVENFSHVHLGKATMFKNILAHFKQFFRGDFYSK